MNDNTPPPEAIAVIGMSGRFPDAKNPDEFWQNLISGKDGITRFNSREEADGSKYVGARSLFDEPDRFDASFFGIYPKEAELMDPQHRVFLECAWEAMEDGGYEPTEYPGLVGVYAGLSLNTYLLNNLGKSQDLANNYQVAEYQTMLGNDKDFLPVRVSYKLNLRGPSMTVQSACSTSLVAICQAATSLLTYQCDMALAGGVSISFPQDRLYRFTEEGMVSPDGTCRAFDADAAGTVFGHGCGVVLLKRLSEAIADRDPILAVIKGWAVNNDGSDKIGFAAPGLNAQAEVIAMAQASAGVHPSEISYVEAHGTGTPLGDPIEVAALTKAFRQGGAEESGYCALGTGKTHIGHLDVAAGVTGLIKTIQQFRHEEIPALLHFNAPNPRIDFAGSPFKPVSKTLAWKRSSTPRLAGVSAFGVGGTNAHVVMEESPTPLPTTYGRGQELFVLSAKTATALDAMSQRLADHLENHPVDLADVAYTLAQGRRAFPFRRSVTATNREDAIRKLREVTKTVSAPANKRKIAFLFPGQGSQYVDMSREIYDAEPLFKATVDECATLLLPLVNHDIRATLYPSPHERENAGRDIHRTALTQPAIFVVEYALAKLWQAWGVQPDVLIGHSIGEYVAAVLAGTFTLPDALRLLAIRARMMQELPGGAMLAIRAGADEITLPQGISIAARNSPELCTVSGSHEAIANYQKFLEAQNIPCRLLNTSHAFHSEMMEPMVDAFTTEAGKVNASAPGIRWISTSTGAEVDAATISDPTYWSCQLRHEVRFSDALAVAMEDENLLLLEVGPGQALSQFARQHPSRTNQAVVSTLATSKADLADLIGAAGDLWTNNGLIDWISFYQLQTRARVHLPTYPFERQSYWIDQSNSPLQALPMLAAQPPQEEQPLLPPMERLPDLLQQLRTMVLDLSGIRITDDAATFTELGFDSLFLTQASQAVQSRFGVKITFRQMLGDLSSVAAIAKHLDQEIPASAQVTRPAAPAPTVSIPAGNASLEQLMAQQMQLMQALLAKQSPPTTLAAGSGLTEVKWPAHLNRMAVTGNRFGPYKPIEKGEKGGLTDTQQTALDDLISRYVAKTPGSKNYTAEHRPHYADPRAVSGFKSMWKEMVYPIVSSRSKNSRIWDIDGNEYVDITMGFGTYFFGHSPDWLVEAIEKQLHTGMEIGPQSPIAGKLAKAVSEFTGMDRVTFCNTGSEAVMAGMRLARTISGRSRIAYFTGDYHGMFEEVLVRGAWVDGVYKAQPIAPGIPQSLVENMLVLDYADPASLEILKTHAHELAAVMVEPVQSRAPGLQPREFMHAVRKITRESGAALIFDEVVTGFRCAPGGAQAYFGVEADLATYGKVIGGGMPIGVLAGKKEYMDALDGGAWNYGDDSFPEVGVTFFAGTFVRHPLALAAAWRVVEHLKAEGPRLQIEMEERVARLCRTLNDWFDKIGMPLHIPHFSAHAVIEHAPDLKYASLLWYFLREKGIHIWEGRPLYFTTAHTDEDFDKFIMAFTGAVTEMQAAGFLPASPEGAGTPPSAFPRFDSAPTTEAQREIFHAVQMGEEANCSFNESNIIRLDGEIDSSAIKAALADIVARHSALRSTFSEDGNVQYFHPSTRHVEIMEHDFSSITSTSPLAMLPLTLVKNAECSTPFDLTDGPLIRLHLIHLPGQKHELLFTAHHIICDGWSFGMILAELATAYNARKAGQLPKLPPAMSFAEYARLEVRNQEAGEVKAAEDFWVSKFSKEAPVLELPTDRARPMPKSYAGAMEKITINPARYARLKQASPKLGGTLFSTLLASFAGLLHRLTGQEDIVIGVPAAGQTRIGKDELIGHCLNFLPLRLSPLADVPFRRFATQVKENVLEAYDHQEHTFGTLLKKISIPRDTSRVPLISVIFNIDKSGLDQIHFDGLTLDVQTNPKQFVNFDLFFNLVQTDERLIVECEYNTDLHDRTTIRSWLASYEQMIESVIENADLELKHLEIVGEADRRKLLDEWNNTAAPLPLLPSIHQLIEEQVDLQPDAPALYADGKMLTYQELDRHANALAVRLQQAGAGRETLVGICASRRPELLVAILATLKAGAAYVPIDPSYPADRIAYILNDAKAPILLTERSVAASLPADQNAQRIFIDDALASSGDRLPAITQASDLAYIIYTSGSTGQPKGVAIEHRNTLALIGWARTVYSREDLAGVLFSTSICFDLSAYEMFVTLSTGGALILAENALHLHDHPHRDKITLINTVPSAITELIEAELVPDSVKIVNLAGEALATSLVDLIHSSTKVEKVYDLYGPSEDTTYSTFTLRLPGKTATIGRPISNTQAYILDPNGKLLPAGVSGELYLGGAGLARGYLYRPELTAEKFVPNPFSTDPGARLYRTGDRSRFFADGNIQFLGRLDHQVKVRGFRIELGEIETLLEEHPAIEKAVATVHDGRLVAYLTSNTSPQIGDGTAIWQDQWDMLYSSAIEQSGSEKLDRLDSVIAGWAGVENLDDQVSEWIDTTVKRIQRYDGKRLFEIGCGTGQILSRLAPDAETYWGADISKVAIDALQKHHPLSQLNLLHRPADDFSGVPEQHFDTVIINSVAQYFPNADYLATVLQNAADCVKPGGRIFLGDIQSHALLPVHHAEAFQKRAMPEMTAGQLKAKLEARLASESELSVDPAWFTLLREQVPAISHIEILLRRGKVVNETNVYHYDVILHVGAPPTTLPLPAETRWRKLNVEQLEAILAEDISPLYITGIPDARLAAAIAFHHALQQADDDSPLPGLPQVPTHAVSAEEIFRLAEQFGFRAHVRWQGDGCDGLMEAVLIHAADRSLPAWPAEVPDGPATAYANFPKSAGNPSPDLSPDLRKHLATRLPEYMIPSSFVMLENFPLTPNGKVDRKALPAPGAYGSAPAPIRTTIAPRTDVEVKLLEIWKQVLGKDDLSIEDDIFDLGGDSILIFQITTRATRAGLSITPAQIFKFRTIAALAAAGTATVEAPKSPSIQRVNRDAYRRKP